MDFKWGLFVPLVLIVCACGSNKAPVAAQADRATAPVSAPGTAASGTPAVAPPPPQAKSESKSLAPGVIRVQMLDVLDSSTPPSAGTFIRGRVADDVIGADHKLAIPAGAFALIVPLGFGKTGNVSHIALSLFSVDLEGRQYRLKVDAKDPATALITEDATQGNRRKSAHITDGDIVDFTLHNPLTLK